MWCLHIVQKKLPTAIYPVEDKQISQQLLNIREK